MTGSDSIQITLDLRSAGLAEPELEELTQVLYTQMHDMPEARQISRFAEVDSLDPLPGSQFLPGLLSLQINPQNIKALVTFLWERLVGRTTELELETKDLKLKLKVASGELPEALREVEQFIAAVSR